MLPSRKVLSVIMVAIMFTLAFLTPVKAETHDELFVPIGDSLMRTKTEDWEKIADNLNVFQQEWDSVKNNDSKQSVLVDQELKKVHQALEKRSKSKEDIHQALSALSNAVMSYDQEQNPTNNEQEKQKLAALFPQLTELKASVKDHDTDKAKNLYQSFLTDWTANEKIVRTESVATYGKIEKEMALIRIAITQDPPDFVKAEGSIGNLETTMKEFLSGKAVKEIEETHTLSEVTALLGKSNKEISNKEFKQASETLDQLLTIWPAVEGDVQTKDSKLYSEVETKIPAAISLLNSKNVNGERASKMLTELENQLYLLNEKTSYSYWDAALILLREGLEGLLIVATLIAFLRKTGHSNKQKWIWAGVAAGMLASAILAIVINMLFSQISAASSREYIEGITGIVAVMMMLSVGAWLHNKTNIGAWNKYVNKQMGQAIATGSLLSFSFTSFLSIFREGAETIIFYTGMAPNISLQHLLMGIAMALIILIIVGYFIIHFGVRIPIRTFFLIATCLIYFLAFKILGISIHAMQISKVIPAHTTDLFPFVEAIGLYPTYETILSQLGLLILVLGISFAIKKMSSMESKKDDSIHS